MFLPFPFSHFAVSLMLSLPLWLLTATSPSHRIYSNSRGFEEERSLFAVGTNMSKIYTVQYIKTLPLLFWHDVNFMKLFKGILHRLHHIFFYGFLPSFNLFHDTCISWSSNKFSMWILGCAALQWKEIWRQRMKLYTNAFYSYYSPFIRERSESFWQETVFVCFLQYRSWVLNTDALVCIHLRSRIGMLKDWWWVTT